jgi:Flp pilus assembly pilin Flp
VKLFRRFLQERYGGTYIEFAMIGLILTLATMSFITALMTALQEKEADAALDGQLPGGAPAAAVQIETPAKGLPNLPKAVRIEEN